MYATILRLLPQEYINQLNKGIQKYFFKSVNNSKSDKNLFYLKIDRDFVLFSFNKENFVKEILSYSGVFILRGT